MTADKTVWLEYLHRLEMGVRMIVRATREFSPPFRLYKASNARKSQKTVINHLDTSSTLGCPLS